MHTHSYLLSYTTTLENLPLPKKKIKLFYIKPLSRDEFTIVDSETNGLYILVVWSYIRDV